MNRIAKKKEEETRFLDSKTNMIKVIIGAAVLVCIIVVLMLLEAGKGEILVNNNTDLKLEYVKAYFVNIEGAMNEGVKFENIDADSYDKVPSGNHELRYQNANIEVVFKFENYEELFVDAGIFNEDFSGDIKIDFDQLNKDEVKMKVKATTGLITSQLTECNEEYTVNLTEGYVAE